MILIWFHIIGFGEAAVKLQRDWNVNPQDLPFAEFVKTHALVNLIHKGLQYCELETTLIQVCIFIGRISSVVMVDRIAIRLNNMWLWFVAFRMDGVGDHQNIFSDHLREQTCRLKKMMVVVVVVVVEASEPMHRSVKATRWKSTRDHHYHHNHNQTELA